MTPTPGGMWMNNESGKFYLYKETGKMRLGKGEWVEAANYERDGQHYTRPMGSFLESFSLIDPARLALDDIEGDK
jgi:hypothetical protein